MNMLSMMGGPMLIVRYKECEASLIEVFGPQLFSSYRRVLDSIFRDSILTLHGHKVISQVTKILDELPFPKSFWVGETVTQLIQLRPAFLRLSKEERSREGFEKAKRQLRGPEEVSGEVQSYEI